MALEARAATRGALRPHRLSPLTVGIMIFLGSELMFFASLFGMYFTLRANNAAWPPPGVDLPLLRPAVFTAVLVASSGTMQMAVRAIKRGSLSSFRRWVVLTLVMGLVFLFGQGWDYVELGRAGVTIASNAWGSAFYTMTGFHALHVTAGLLCMLVLMGRAAAGAYDDGNHAGIEAVTYYWHFVDVVWVFLFTTIFLIK